MFTCLIDLFPSFNETSRFLLQQRKEETLGLKKMAHSHQALRHNFWKIMLLCTTGKRPKEIKSLRTAKSSLQTKHGPDLYSLNAQVLSHLPWACHATGSAWPLWRHRVCVPGRPLLRGWLQSFPREQMLSGTGLCFIFFFLLFYLSVYRGQLCREKERKRVPGSKQFQFVGNQTETQPLSRNVLFRQEQ